MNTHTDLKTTAKNTEINPQRVRPYSIREAAAATGVAYHTLWRLHRRGELPATRLGRRVLIPARIIEDILEGRWGLDEGAS